MLDHGITARDLVAAVNVQLPEDRQRGDRIVGEYLRGEVVPGADWVEAAANVLGRPAEILFHYVPERTEAAKAR
jgi:hypothetical protein